MKFTILNGSPKGNLSVSLQSCLFIEKKFPTHSFKVHHIAQSMHLREEKLNEIITDIQNSDGIIWSFPVYTGLVQSSFKLFIEKVFENEMYTAAFKNKYTFALSTSIHFYDNTSHDYMHAICDDLEMKYIGKYSAGMGDLTQEQGQKNLVFLFNRLLLAIENQIPFPRYYAPIQNARFNQFVYSPTTTFEGELQQEFAETMVIITDYDPNSQSQQIRNLKGMIDQTRTYCQIPPNVVNLRTLNIKGGCLGCCQCGASNDCIYGDSDDFHEFFESVIKPAKIIIFAFPIVDRFFSSRVKLFLDRSFYNTHIPVYVKKQIGYIISGALSQNQHIIELSTKYEFQKANIAGFVTDESFDSEIIDKQLHYLVSTLIESAKHGIINPPTMFGVGGLKIFRDEIYGHLQFPFIADYKYYKKNGLFDYPKPKLGTKILKLMYNIEGFKKKVQPTIKEKMVASSKKVVAEVNK